MTSKVDPADAHADDVCPYERMQAETLHSVTFKPLRLLRLKEVKEDGGLSRDSQGMARWLAELG